MEYRFKSNDVTVFLNVPYVLRITSSSGLALSNGETVLSAAVIDVKTESEMPFPDSCFKWTRRENSAEFTAVQGASLRVTESDLVGESATFSCYFKADDFDFSAESSFVVTLTIKGEDGSSYSVLIHSSNGNVFRFPNVSTTLSAQILRNAEDITDALEDWRFTWKRVTSDPAADSSWNTSSKAIGHKTIDITGGDCEGRTVFFLEFELPDGTTIQSA